MTITENKEHPCKCHKCTSYANQVANERVEKVYNHGFLAGLFAYAWMKDGVYYVGTSGTTLKKAQADIEKTWNYYPDQLKEPTNGS